jgi:hypothetical protein
MSSQSLKEYASIFSLQPVSEFARSLIPGWKDIFSSLKLFLYVVLGGIILIPITSKLPLLGWDWYFFFTSHHPVDNINNLHSPFFPFTKYLLMSITWMPWRDSLALLAGLTFMAIAIGTWKSGGKYGSIFLALLTPIPLIALWVGHPEGLALLGMLTNFIPLAFTKPQLTFWAFFRSKALAFWALFVLALVVIIWPSWLQVTGTTWNHEASFGWQALGWPLLILGVILLAGAGDDPWRLMAAGCFLTPDIMPYHMVVLIPAIGRVKGYWKIAVWFSTWLLLLGVGLGGNYRYINLLFPICVYAGLQTPTGYRDIVQTHLAALNSILRLFVKKLRISNATGIAKKSFFLVIQKFEKKG